MLGQHGIARALAIVSLAVAPLASAQAQLSDKDGLGRSGINRHFNEFIERLQKQNQMELDQRFDLCKDNPDLPQCLLLGQRIDPCIVNPELPQCLIFREHRG